MIFIPTFQKIAYQAQNHHRKQFRTLSPLFQKYQALSAAQSLNSYQQ
ncbi:hypothetical protein UMNK88_1762 [Escherichia coli UMNK88]|nr:hypothetical protein UMNK88_1762 [Escherichia coli UMNK88]